MGLMDWCWEFIVMVRIVAALMIGLLFGFLYIVSI